MERLNHTFVVQTSYRSPRRARRFRVGACAAIALLAGSIGAATMITMLAEALEYRRDLLWREPWRALTGHLVHINGRHALLNLLAFALLAALFRGTLTARRLWLLFAVTAIGIASGLALFFPEIAWYRGLSGVLHGLYFAGAVLLLVHSLHRVGIGIWWPVCLLLLGAIKIAAEQPFDSQLRHADWLGAAVVPQAHLLGAVTGVFAGMLFARWRSTDNAPSA